VENVLSQIRAMQELAGGRQNLPAPQAAARADFAHTLRASVEQVNGAQQQATRVAQAFEQGEPNVNLQDVMISMQKANISFQTLVQVRNRVVAAYQDMMNMQV
jgi:flagellar hook-basal body complex protein FliE